jgi:hypothetical protein
MEKENRKYMLKKLCKVISKKQVTSRKEKIKDILKKAMDKR